MMKNFATIALLILLFFLGFIVGRRSHGNAPNPPDNPSVDTLYIRDTIKSVEYKEMAIPKGWQLVSAQTLIAYEDLLAEYRDSLAQKPMLVTEHDTTYIAVPISQTTFTDDKTYKCLVEGYATKMIWHEAYQETQVITQTYTRDPRWALSPTVSAYVIPNAAVLSGGLRLDLWKGRWQFSPSAGYMLNFHDFQWYAGATVSYNLFRR